MTGRDGGAPLEPLGNSPIVILVRPQLADNIGAVARAMANGGLFHLRLVEPRDGWPQERAWANASGADRLLDALTLYGSVADAVADGPSASIDTVLEGLRFVRRTQILLGAALLDLLAVLDNDDLAAADALIRYPLNPAFMSLNLAQAVMVMAYEWWSAEEHALPRSLMTNETRVATKGELETFFSHLVDELDASGFLDNKPKRPGMVRNLRHFFGRGEVTEQELRTLHGVVSELSHGRKRQGREE